LCLETSHRAFYNRDMARTRKTTGKVFTERAATSGNSSGAPAPQRAALERTARDEQRLKKLVQLARSLPQVRVEAVGEHRGFRVAGKAIAWYQFDHHSDGIVSLCCKSTLARQGVLVACDPRNYFVPEYVGQKGWVGLRLDQPVVDWGEAMALLFEAYRLQAPARLVAQIDCKTQLGSGDWVVDF